MNETGGEHRNPAEGSGVDEEGELKPLFALGQIVGTPGALQVLEEAGKNPLELVARHVTGDWGQLPEEDVAENERAVREGNRVFSSYKLDTGDRIWVISEWDRSVTTVLRPQDY